MRLILTSLLLLATTASAQTSPVKRLSNGEGFDFTIKNIMRGPELYGRAPSNVRWSADGRWIYFSWNTPGTDWREALKPFRIRAAAGAKPEALTLAQSDSALPYTLVGELSPDGKTRAVDAAGDLYIVSLRDGSARRLTQTVAAENGPTFSTDGKTLYFIRDGNAFSMSLAGGEVRQLTDIRAAGAGATAAAPAAGGRGGGGAAIAGRAGGPPQTMEQTRSDSTRSITYQSRLEQQQKDLFEVIRDRARADSVTAADRAARAASGLATINLAANERVGAIQVSPNGQAAIVVIAQDAGTTRSAEVPQFVTSTGYVENIRGRTKVGDAFGRSRALWVSLPSGKATPLRVFASERDAGFVNVGRWSNDGSRAVLFAFPANHKSRVLYTVRSDSAALTTIETLRDTAWVGGPCSSCAGFLEGGKKVWFVSESSGYAHIYTADAAGGGAITPLTSGKWEVMSASLSADEKEFYLNTSEISPNEKQFYRMAVNGGPRTRITSTPGGHAVTPSPDGKWLADVYSFVNQPPDLFLVPNVANAPQTRLTTSPSQEWLKGPWIEPAIVQIPASDGLNVPAHIYRPEDMGARPNGAAVIFVHGAGYLHNVGNFWSEYPREYMFNQYLAKAGYVVLDLDYRASSGYGRDWRTAIYRFMGGRDLQDHVDASKWLTKTYNIPPNRVGLYGGSYGGFITLMALFTTPEYFGSGAALRSVTDWAHYNEGYTSNILNRPQDDTLAYYRSSPIYFAEGLRAPLLMLHGMVDVNVMYQDIVRLQQRLIELGKTDWELASYPVEDHAFVRPSSWTDEYLRIFNHFERSIGRPAPAARTGGGGGDR